MFWIFVLVMNKEKTLMVTEKASTSANPSFAEISSVVAVGQGQAMDRTMISGKGIIKENFSIPCVYYISDILFIY